MSENPLVSIVIPVYNTERYLSACLSSVCAQTLSNIEVICVDDGSTDGSPALLDARATTDPRVRVIHQANGGVSHARNVGLSQATGTYVLFVDSDDYLSVRACERLAFVAERDGADIVVFGGSTFPKVSWIDRNLATRDLTLRNAPFAALFGEVGSYPLMCNKLYRLELLTSHELSFNEGLRLGEDHAFQMCAFPHASVVSFVQDSLYHYRCGRAGSAMELMRDDAAAKAANHLNLVEYVLETWEREGWLAEHRDELVKWSCDLLEQDVPLCAFAEREAFARRYRQVMDRFCLAGEPYQSLRVRRSVRFLGGADLAVERPLVTVVMLPCESPEVNLRGFTSLANQSVQSLELLVVCAQGQSDAFTQTLAADPRARTLDSPQSALAEARGRYVLFASLRDTYAWDALGTMLGAMRQAWAEGFDPQLATIRDLHDATRSEDLTRDLAMSSGSTWITGDDLGDRLLSFSSLSCSNKLWLTRFAREQGLDPLNPVSMGKMLLRVTELCPCADRLLTLGLLDDLDAKEAAALAAGYAAALVSERDELACEPLAGAPACGFERVLVGGIMGMAELLGETQLSAFFAAAETVLAETNVLGECSREGFLFAGDYDDAELLMAEGAELFAEGYDARRAARLAGEVDALREKVGFLEGDLKGRTEQLEGINASLSFRLGRAATSVPRALRSKVKAVVGR